MRDGSVADDNVKSGKIFQKVAPKVTYGGNQIDKYAFQSFTVKNLRPFKRETK